MSAPAEQLTLPLPRTYTRSDFAALRAWVQRVPVAAIAARYYDLDTTPYEDEPAALERHIKTMRDDLVHLALLNGSSALAEYLKTSIRQHGSARLTTVSLKMVEAAAQLAAAAPASTHAVGLWFRPPVARRLAGEGIATLGELIAFCNRRGGRWWRRVPRIGAGRARVLVAWCRAHADTLGATIAADVDATEPFGRAVPAEAIALVPQATTSMRYARTWRAMPISRRRCVPTRASSSACCRGPSPCAAPRCRHSRSKTATRIRRFCVRRQPRLSDRLRRARPGAGARSHRAACRSTVSAMRSARCAARSTGWSTSGIWPAIRGAQCEIRSRYSAPRWRTARALLLLMGDSGLRIAEAVAATRDQLQQLPADGDLPPSWQLKVVGKGSKARVTPVSDACAVAIAAHWRDRGTDFKAGTERRALVAPLTMPATPNATAKAARLAAGDQDEIGGYAVRPARGLVVWALAQLRSAWPATLPDLSEAERIQLARTSPHALRHTSAPRRLLRVSRSTSRSACWATRRCRPPLST